MYTSAPHLAQLGAVKAGDTGAISALARPAGPISGGAFVNAVHDFYLTNPIARASAVMAEMSALKKNSAGAARDAAE